MHTKQSGFEQIGRTALSIEQATLTYDTETTKNSSSRLPFSNSKTASGPHSGLNGQVPSVWCHPCQGVSSHWIGFFMDHMPVASWDTVGSGKLCSLLEPQWSSTVVGEGIRMHVFVQDPG